MRSAGLLLRTDPLVCALASCRALDRVPGIELCPEEVLYIVLAESHSRAAGQDVAGSTLKWINVTGVTGVTASQISDMLYATHDQG